AVDRDDDAVEAGFDGPPGIVHVEEMAVGRRDGVDPARMRMTDHVEESGIDVRLALEVEDEVDQPRMQLVDDLPEEILPEVARRAAEGPQAARAFRAAEVAGGGRLD